MANYKSIAEFPDVENKLQAPSKKSLFERQRADAEAKRQREEAETKAVYEDFVKSFDDGDEGSGYARDAGDKASFTGVSTTAKRHYTSGQSSGIAIGFNSGWGSGAERGRNSSGPGSLGPPPSSLNRKRPFDSVGFLPRVRDKRNDREERGLLAFDDYEVKDRISKKPFTLDNDEDEKRSEQEEDRAIPKPTIKLASMPPGTSPAVIKSLIPPKLHIEYIRILPPAGPSVSSERKSMSAIVTLAKDTAANDIDAAVNALQNKYLGYGYYLNIQRHLSSAVLSNSESATMVGLGTSLASQPFGAKAVDMLAINRGHAPPHQGRFAPPSLYDAVGPGRTGPLLHVPVKAPQDIKELKLIHKVIEALLTHGPEFEALLMSRPDVQREEKWAWLWDARSVGASWYRWRLWEILTGIQTRRNQGRYIPLFEGSSAWKQPDQLLTYEYTTHLDEFVSNSEYNSSSDENSGDEVVRRQNYMGRAPNDAASLVADEKLYLNPLEKAKLTHLLARLPTTTGTLRKGDVARVTAFAISHAGRGADEIVQMIILNVKKPFAYTSANPCRKKTKDKLAGSDEEEDSDTSAASLVGLYVISDILSSSSTSGVRHAWKYRQLFEVALKKGHIFEELGRMEKKMSWGRLRAEKWKRSVENILRLWEGWCLFPQDSQESFASLFDKPPLTAKEKEEMHKKELEEGIGEKGKGSNKWKSVEVKHSEVDNDAYEKAQDNDIDGMSMDEDIDGEPMADDDDIDGIPMDDEEKSTDEDQDIPATLSTLPEPMIETKIESKPVPPLRQKRPRAVDMFADSDESDET